jgi:dTDP-4-dehydrorhamnose 3,5-epimerase
MSIPGVFLLKLRYFRDSRGNFVETYNARAACEAGLKVHFVEDNQAFSSERGTVRALHFQTLTKLVRTRRGRIYEGAVGLRADWPTFGRWVSSILTAQSVFVPRGFAHGLLHTR